MTNADLLSRSDLVVAADLLDAYVEQVVADNDDDDDNRAVAQETLALAKRLRAEAVAQTKRERMADEAMEQAEAVRRFDPEFAAELRGRAADLRARNLR